MDTPVPILGGSQMSDVVTFQVRPVTATVGLTADRSNTAAG